MRYAVYKSCPVHLVSDSKFTALLQTAFRRSKMKITMWQMDFFFVQTAVNDIKQKEN